MSKKNSVPVASGVPVGSGLEMKQYIIFSDSIQGLEGKMLTFIDASISDPIQRKAMKDLLRPMIWSWAIESDRSDNFDAVWKGIK